MFCAASTLVADVLDRELVELVRTPVSVHYDTGHPDVPVLCVATPAAVRLPNSVLVAALPTAPPRLAVRRWWRPARPTGLTAPPRTVLAGLADTSYDVLSPAALLGSGPGLTPRGDDVLAGALVTAHATGDARSAGWRRETRRALATRRTTAVSRALLTHALDGYAIPQLSDLLVALCRGADPSAPAAALRAVGRSSGQALVDGVVHALSTAATTYRGAA